ncbi:MULTISPECIES: phage tail protein I [unclassified Shinella]|uniref:phage tail protein I n=1 Tax=unclassified Shinella TaxID=2643062 RepID=UPI00234F29F5|nr:MULTISPECIES: phage tail protein I [unclassified Shinella]MCO5153382.1 phage tail protein I [Shinella sp.]MDC7260561.1 phage tail protein I [Shinella sp. HY16]MDC7267456.1 phage tail protein I [Shinella sp. YZ44]
MAPTLLPAGSTEPFERVLEQGSAERWEQMDIDVIRRAKDPWACPAHLLPYLAHEWSVDLWSDSWNEVQKRRAIDAAVRMHRLKGTEEGLRLAISLAGGELVSVVAPPSKTFLSPNTTREQREAFLARYPQLRIYPRRDRGRSKGLFPGTKHSFVERRFPLPTEAFFRALPRAFIWDHGAETELTVLERRHTTEVAETEERVDLRQRGKRRLNHFGPLGHRKIFALESTAAKRIFSVHTRDTLEVPGQEQLARRLVLPSMVPIDVVAQMVRQRGIRRTATAGRMFPGAKWFAGFLQSSRAKERVYRRTYLFDPKRALNKKGAFTFLGKARLGMPAHHAEIKVKIRYKRHRFAFGRFVAGFVLERPKTELALVKAAIRSHKRLSDKILITTKTTDVARAGVEHLAGSIAAGQLVEV